MRQHLEFTPDHTTNGILGIRCKCRFCGETHVAATQARLEEITQQCREKYCRFLMNREFMRQTPVTIPVQHDDGGDAREVIVG